MFKLAVFTDEISQDPEKAAKMAADFGLEGVEIRSAWDKGAHDLSADQVKELRRLLEDRGLKVSNIASPFLKSKLGDEEGYKKHFEILRGAIAVGRELGTNMIRGFTCMLTEDTPAVWAEVERLYHLAIPILEKEDAIIVVENEHVTSGATAALVARFLEKINHPRVRAVWDPANEIHAEGGETPYPDAYLRMRPYMAHVHVKDGIRRDENGKPKITRVGDGEIDWPGQLQALVDDGYEGWVSLETHWRAVPLTEEQVKRPGGEAYSATGEEGSRQCLVALKEMVGKLRVR